MTLVEQGLHQPRNWGSRITWKQEGPGIHQIRLYANSNPHTNLAPAGRSELSVACSCGTHLTWIYPGGDCWTPFNEHLKEVNAVTDTNT